MENNLEPNIVLELEPVKIDPLDQASFTSTPFEEVGLTFIYTTKPGLEGLEELLQSIEPADFRKVLLTNDSNPVYTIPRREDIEPMLLNFVRGHIEKYNLEPGDTQPLINKKLEELLELYRKETSTDG